jgi:hypothetical protein
MTGEIMWDHPTQDIPEAGLTVERAADSGERERIAAAIDLTACVKLEARYSITPLSLGRYKLAGDLHAELEQACVVTLEPVASTIDETFAVIYWPPEVMPEPPDGQVDIDGEPDAEPIRSGQIDAGRIVFETLAAAVDPFPRRAGATFEGPLSSPQADRPESPFAVLASLKGRS